MRKYFVFLVFALFFSGIAFGQDGAMRFIFVDKVFVPSTKIETFTLLPNFKVNCVGGGCSQEFLKENIGAIQELLTATQKYFHIEKAMFEVRVVNPEYFKKFVAAKFPKKRSFLSFFSFKKDKTGAVVQGDKDDWMITLPRFSGQEDLQVVWVGMIKALDRQAFGKDFLDNKAAKMVAEKILGQVQFITPDLVIR